MRAVPKGNLTRPTTQKTLQAWFNATQGRWIDAQVVDLFAGTGALGLEAVRRGAVQAVFVERASAALQSLRANVLREHAEAKSEVIAGDVESVLSEWQRGEPPFARTFDGVFVDPPYSLFDDADWLARNIVLWANAVKDDGLLMIEWRPSKQGVSALPESIEIPSSRSMIKTREKKYGDTWLTFYERATPGE